MAEKILSDVELLKASLIKYGFDDGEISKDYRHNTRQCLFSAKLHDSKGAGYWNPLADHKQAIELLIAEEMEVYFSMSEGVQQVFASYVDDSDRVHYVAECCGGEPEAAFMRSVVRAFLKSSKESTQ